MTDAGDHVASGYYARQQIYSGDPLIGWSHRRRFRSALALARPFAGGRVLDYGCGDGTFLGLLDASDHAPARAVGADIDPRIVFDCRTRFAASRRLTFTEVSALGHVDDASYDAVFCMEVLEHIPDPRPLFNDFERLLRPHGTLVVSVPIETGLPVLVKQIVRRAAGWRGVGNYPGTTGYRPVELWKSLVASSAQHVARPIFHGADGTAFHDHKGFNWRVLRSAIASRFELVKSITSPFNWLGPQLGTQLWFVARRSHGERP
jgi:SAM-dependent methyltransferase